MRSASDLIVDFVDKCVGLGSSGFSMAPYGPDQVARDALVGGVTSGATIGITSALNTEMKLTRRLFFVAALASASANVLKGGITALFTPYTPH